MSPSGPVDGVEQRLWDAIAWCDNQVKGIGGALAEPNRVLMYHSVGGRTFGAVTEARFRDDLEYLTRNYQIVDLPAVLNAEAGESCVALTFDDGLADFYERALPLLREYDAPATVFVISRTLYDDTVMHYEDDAPQYEYMSASQVRELVEDELVTIGNHTRTHPDLTTIPDRTVLETEIHTAQAEFEQQVRFRPSLFCYPYGRFNAEVSEIVERTHECAVIARPTRAAENYCRFTIPRVPGHWDHRRVKWHLTGLASQADALAARVAQIHRQI